jgi:hypothetical protein
MLGGLRRNQIPAVIHVRVSALITQKIPIMREIVFTAVERVNFASKEMKPRSRCDSIDDLAYLF